jgi:hypothetical protein
LRQIPGDEDDEEELEEEEVDEGKQPGLTALLIVNVCIGRYNGCRI